jgi:hypothetical protein
MMEGDLVYLYENDESVFRLSLRKPLEIANRLSGAVPLMAVTPLDPARSAASA